MVVRSNMRLDPAHSPRPLPIAPLAGPEGVAQILSPQLVVEATDDRRRLRDEEERLHPRGAAGIGPSGIARCLTLPGARAIARPLRPRVRVRLHAHEQSLGDLERSQSRR